MAEVRTLTLKIDTAVMFDMLHAVNGDTSAVGNRLAQLCLGGRHIFDQIGLALYGIIVAEEQVEQLGDDDPST